MRKVNPRKHAPGNLLFACLVGVLLQAESAAGGEECRLGGTSYPETITVCSGGLAQTCMNGTWQSNDGQRCDQPTGTLLGPRRPFREKNTEPLPEGYREPLRSAGDD